MADSGGFAARGDAGCAKSIQRARSERKTAVLRGMASDHRVPSTQDIPPPGEQERRDRQNHCRQNHRSRHPLGLDSTFVSRRNETRPSPKLVALRLVFRDLCRNGRRGRGSRFAAKQKRSPAFLRGRAEESVAASPRWAAGAGFSFRRETKGLDTGERQEAPGSVRAAFRRSWRGGGRTGSRRLSAWWGRARRRP